LNKKQTSATLGDTGIIQSHITSSWAWHTPQHELKNETGIFGWRVKMFSLSQRAVSGILRARWFLFSLVHRRQVAVYGIY